MPDQSPVTKTTKLTLDSGEHYAYSRSTDGVFTFRNIPSGVHVIHVHDSDLAYPHVKVQLLEDAMDKPRFLEYPFLGAAKKALIPSSISGGVDIVAVARNQYFEKRQGFSFMSLLKNPMILFGMFGMAMMYYMPKMMENMDPEQRAEMQKQMAAQQDPTAMLKEMWGGEEKDDDDDDEEESRKAAIKADKKGGGSVKQRRGKTQR
jgi:hypothetical protein